MQYAVPHASLRGITEHHVAMNYLTCTMHQNASAFYESSQLGLWSFSGYSEARTNNSLGIASNHRAYLLCTRIVQIVVPEIL